MHSTSNHFRMELMEYQIIFLYLFAIVTALTLVTFLWGVASWCTKEKFRTFRNYVFLNAIIPNLLNLLLNGSMYFIISLIPPGYDMYVFRAISYVHGYLSTVKFHWLIVIGYIFYDDIVKIFNAPVQKIYSKSTIFGWGASLLITVICIFLSIYLQNENVRLLFIIPIISGLVNRFIPGFINCYLFTKVVYSLWCSSNSDEDKPSIWRQLCIATLIFILIDVVLLLDLFVLMFIESSTNLSIMLSLSSEAYIIALDILFIFSQSHYNTFYESNSEIDEKQSVRDDLPEKKSFESTYSKPMALDDVKFKKPDV